MSDANAFLTVGELGARGGVAVSALQCYESRGFWVQASEDSRLSEGFQRLCRVNASKLQQVIERA